MLDLVEMSSGLFGAIIGGFFALAGAVLAWGLQCFLSWWQERGHVRALLQALNDEVEVLGLVYMKRIGVQVEAVRGKEALGLHFPISSSYFLVYDSNCASLGRIRSSVLRRSVVETYTYLKALADTFCYNNRLLQEFEDLRRQQSDNPESEILQRLIGEKELELRDYGEGIWAVHQEAMVASLKLKSLIQARLQGWDVP